MNSLSLIAAMAAAALVSGCAQYGGFAAIGTGTPSSDVQARMGEPAEKLAEANGDSVWYYPSGRYGRQTYAVRVGSNGTVRDVEGRLTEANVGRIVADKTTMKEVRELMGPPSHTTFFPLSRYTSWEYPMIPGSPSDWMILWVNFTDDGVVRQVLYMQDPEKEYLDPGGEWN